MQDRFIHVINRKTAKFLGLKRYFTASPCIKNHISERLTSAGSCITCLRASTKEWAASNPDTKKALLKAWRIANKERVAETNKAYKSSHAEQIKQYEAENIVERRKQALAYRDRNVDSCLARARRWKAENPEKAKNHLRKRRALKYSASGSHSHEDISAILSAQKAKCASCKKKLSVEGPGKYHIDHVMPLSKGGSNDKYNLQILCPSCNLSKHAKDPIEWAQTNGRLL